MATSQTSLLAARLWFRLGYGQDDFLPIAALHCVNGYWHSPVVCLSVCLSVYLSVMLCIAALRVGVQG